MLSLFSKLILTCLDSGISCHLQSSRRGSKFAMAVLVSSDSDSQGSDICLGDEYAPASNILNVIPSVSTAKSNDGLLKSNTVMSNDGPPKSNTAMSNDGPTKSDTVKSKDGPPKSCTAKSKGGQSDSNMVQSKKRKDAKDVNAKKEKGGLAKSTKAKAKAKGKGKKDPSTSSTPSIAEMRNKTPQKTQKMSKDDAKLCDDAEPDTKKPRSSILNMLHHWHFQKLFLFTNLALFTSFPCSKAFLVHLC